MLSSEIPSSPLQYRQGDVLLVRIEALPAGATKRPDGVIQEGESTGHLHAVDVADADVLEADGGKFVAVRNETCVMHQEHAPITLPQGFYQVVRQREYVPKRLPREVAD